MATVNFYLDRPDRFEKCPIFIVYQHQGKKFKIFTKEKTEKRAWNFDRQRVKKNYAGSIEINRNIDFFHDFTGWAGEPSAPHSVCHVMDGRYFLPSQNFCSFC